MNKKFTFLTIFISMFLLVGCMGGGDDVVEETEVNEVTNEETEVNEVTNEETE